MCGSLGLLQRSLELWIIRYDDVEGFHILFHRLLDAVAQLCSTACSSLPLAETSSAFEASFSSRKSFSRRRHSNSNMFASRARSRLPLAARNSLYEINAAAAMAAISTT